MSVFTAVSMQLCVLHVRLVMCNVPTFMTGACSVQYMTLNNLRLAMTASTSMSAQDARPPNTTLFAPFAPGMGPSPILSYIGLEQQFYPRVMQEKGASLVASGKVAPTNIPGASRTYNDYVTGFLAWADENLPRYPPPYKANLPPLPDRYKADMAYIVNLRRGGYPDVITNRPAEISMRATDPLQNGRVASIGAGYAFVGRS